MACVLAIGSVYAAACTITTTETKNETVAAPPPGTPAPKPKPQAHDDKPKPKPEHAQEHAEAPKPKPEKKPEPDKTASKPEAPAAKPPTQQAPNPPAQHAPEVAGKDDKGDKDSPSANVKPPPAQPERSHIVVPIKVSLEALSQQIDALVPKEDKKDWTPITKKGESPKAEVKVQIWRGDVKVEFSDHTFHITVPVRYAANIRAQVKNPLKSSDWIWIAKDETWGTKDEPQRLTAKFDAKLDVDDDWHIKSDLRVDELKHGDPPSGKICKNAGIEICVARSELAPEVNDRIDEYLRPKLKKALEKVDAKVEKAFNLQARAQSLWNQLQTPQALQVPGAKEPAWLVVQPAAVGLDRPELEGDDVAVALSIDGRIAVQGGAKPKVKTVPLPKLSDVKDPAGFHVIAELNVPDEALSSAINHELDGMHVGKGKQQLTVSGAKVVAQTDEKHPHRITIKVALSSPVQDEVELTGDLVYDAAAQRLSIDHFDFAADSEGVVAKKLAGFDHEAIRKQIAAKAKWDMGALAAPLKKAIGGALNASARDQVHVSGELDQLDVRDFAIDKGALDAKVIVGGTLAVSYTPAK
jgi:hypothetical protein